MPEQTCVPLGAERFQRESLVAPLKNGSKVSKRSSDASLKYVAATRNGNAEYLWLSSPSDALPKYVTVTRNGNAEYLWLSSRSDALPESGKAADSSVTDLLNTSAGYNIKSVIAELEKERAELFALACAAEARVQEAEGKCERAENRLEQETNQLLVAEQQLREFEKNSLRQLQAVEIVRAKTLRTVQAHGEMEARLKETEGRIKEAENDVKSLTLALTEAHQRRAKAEAAARAAEEREQTIEAHFLGADAAAHGATKRRMVFGLLIFENRGAKAVANEATERHKAAEARLRCNVQQGASAKQRLKDFQIRFPRGGTLQHSWVEFREFARKIAKSVDKMLINLFRQCRLFRACLVSRLSPEGKKNQ